MPREKKIPSKPRFEFVTQTAYRCLLEWGYTKFPISPYDVLSNLEDYVSCISWTEAKSLWGQEDPFHLHRLNADGFTIWARDEQKYYLVYDDSVSNSSRVSWTIMHEVGHIVLGHLVEFNETALNRGGMDLRQYGVLEKEANYFVAEFLMPTVILKNFKGISTDEISILFGVSAEAAKKKYDRVFGSDYLPEGENDKFVFRNFYNFLMTGGLEEALYQNIHSEDGKLRKAKYMSICRKCPNCYSYVSDSTAQHCPNCGSIINRSYYSSISGSKKADSELAKIHGIKHISYPFAKVINVNGLQCTKLTVCPVCLNHNFSEKVQYCRVCGTPLITEADRVDTRFTKKDGIETNANKWYPFFENRYRKLMSYNGKLRGEDWVDYRYWEYTRWAVITTHASMDLKTALLYSHAFSDDNDDIHIVTDTEMAAEIMRKEKNSILLYLARTDGIERNQLDVLVPNDL